MKLSILKRPRNVYKRDGSYQEWIAERNDAILHLSLTVLKNAVIWAVFVIAGIYMYRRHTAINRTQNAIDAFHANPSDSLQSEVQRLYAESLSIPLNPFD